MKKITEMKLHERGHEELSNMVDANKAIELCRLMESVTPKYGCHVALTGGTLYKQGMRKDCDIVLYRIRQVENIDYDGLFMALHRIGVERKSGSGWCHKAEWKGINVDLFFPEEKKGDYDGDKGKQNEKDNPGETGIPWG